MSGSQNRVTPHAFFDEYVDLVPLAPGRRVTFLPQDEDAGAVAALLRRYGRFLVFVALPTFLVTAYFLIFAADRYESETRFAVRRPAVSMGALSGILPTASGPQRAEDEAHAVEAYVMSRDAMANLTANHGLDEAFANSGLDFFWSFPSLLGSATTEAKFVHYKRFLSVSNDSGTGVSTIRFEAFRPEDAQRLTLALLAGAEAMINRLNDRAAADALASVETQAAELKERMEAAQNALVGFRSREEVVDPARLSLTVLQTIALLTVQVAEQQAMLSELQAMTPQSPQIAVIRRRIAAIEGQILIERRKLGGDDEALAGIIAEYESLMLEREFSQRAYSAALAAVEATKADNRKSRVYIERIVEPQISDEATYPYRLIWIAVTFLTGLVIMRLTNLSRRMA